MMYSNLMAERFPARDVAFGTVIARLSEPETGPHADNLISNEDSFPRVAGELARRAPPGDYLGVGPDQNFSFLAHAKPGLAFVVDFRRRNLLLHLVHKALFALAGDRVAYLSKLSARDPGALGPDKDEHDAETLIAAFSQARFDRDRLDATIRDVRRTLEPLGVVQDDEWPELATIQAKMAGPGMNARFLALPIYPTFGQMIRTTDRDGQPAHMLSRESFYQTVRQAQQGDRVIPLVGDFAGSGALPRLAGWLREHNRELAVMYISDVEFFLLRGGRFENYIENLSRMPWAEGALIVRTSTREIDHPERVAGDSATTIVRPMAAFLDAARAGRIRHVDDLFDEP